MNRFKEVLKIRVFLLTSLLFIIIGGVVLFTSDKDSIHLAVNDLHSPVFDIFFTYWTHVGDGIFTALTAIAIALYVFKKYRYSTFALGAIALLLCGAFSQFMKRVVFPNAERPLKYFGENVLYLVPDVDVHLSNSFPSGHTTAAFTFFTFASMALFRNNKGMQVLMAVFAALVGYSRMYLSQHFLEDVVTGAILGIITYLIAHWIVTCFPFKQNITA